MKRKNIGITLIVSAYIIIFLTIVLPVVILMRRIPEFGYSFSQWWDTYNILIITGFVVSLLLLVVSDWLREKPKNKRALKPLEREGVEYVDTKNKTV